MDKFKVLVADPISPRGVEELQNDGRFEVIFQTGMKEEQLLEAIPDCVALIVRSETKVNARVLEAARSLKVVGRAGVGVDNVDVEAATARGVIVMNTPDGNTISTAEHTFSLLVSTARTIPQAHASVDRRQVGAQEIPGRRTLRQDPRHPRHGPHRQRTGPARDCLRDARARLRSVPRRQPRAGAPGRTLRHARRGPAARGFHLDAHAAHAPRPSTCSTPGGWRCASRGCGSSTARGAA